MSNNLASPIDVDHPGETSVNTRAGVVWSTINGGASVLVPLGVFILFARLMKPSELSPILMAVALLEVIKALGPQGVYDVVIRRSESEPVYYQAAAAHFLIAGCSLAMIFVVVVLATSMIGKNPLPFQVSILALKILFDYLIMQPQAVLARRMDFKRIGSRGLVAGLLSGIVGVGISNIASPTIGLVSYYVFQSFVSYIITVTGNNTVVRPRWDVAAIREMRSESARATGVRLTAVGLNYFDQILLGFVVGPASIGLYNLGKRIEMFAISLMSSFGQILFQPIFSTVNVDDRSTHVAKSVAAISLVCGVPLVVLAVHAWLAVPFIFGWHWVSATTIVALLGLGGFARALGGVAGALLTATGRNALLLRIGFWSAIFSVILILGLAKFGVLAVSIAVLARNIVFAVVEFVFTGEDKRSIARIIVFNCLIPLLAAAIASYLFSTMAIAVIGLSGAPAIFGVLAVAGLSGGLVGLILLYPRM